MDILNFIYWIRSGRQVTTVDANKTLIPLGLKDGRRDDDYLAGAISVADFVSQYGQGPVGPAGPQGVQGPIGPQGALGPVGPAGLNWQGAWSASGTYVVDDAVGYNGASWFCINNVGPSVTTPDSDPTNWALLAAEGAQGPQGIPGVQGPTGPQGPSGTIAPYTNSVVIAVSSSPGTVMTSDINAIAAINNNWFVRLPENVPAGKEVFVYGSTQVGTGYTNVQPFNLGNTIVTNKSNQSTGNFPVYFADIVRFTSAGNDFWIAENITSSPLRFNNQFVSGLGNVINELATNPTTSALSLATLNATYTTSLYPTGFKVVCPSISGGGLMYIKTGTATWVSVPVTTVV
jgi:hypothetical protein